MLLPFFRDKMNELLIRINTPYNEALSFEENFFMAKEFSVKEKGSPLYMRIDTK
jgi:hypothetical protein